MRDAVVWVGRRAAEMCEYAGGLVLLFRETLYWLVRPKIRHRGVFWQQMVQVGLRTLPVSGVIIFLLGMVMALQTAYQVRALGGDVLIPGLIAVSFTRELAPVMAALVVSGRVGAAITAELGTMAVTEQIDAVDAMGVSPVKYLVVPRFFAMLVMVPVLTVYTDVIGILGGYVVCVGKLGLTHSFFMEAVSQALLFGDIASGLSKSVVFGMLICIVSCWEGMRVKGGAEGVGRATMRSVVTSFLLIVLSDFVFTLAFYIA